MKKKLLLFLLLPSLILSGCAKGSTGGGDTPGGGGDQPGGGGDEPGGGGGEPVDTKVTVNFYLDFNNTETPYATQKVEKGSKLSEPVKPTEAPDPANGEFVGWSVKEVIDDPKDLWNFTTGVVEDKMNLFGIWDATQLSYFIKVGDSSVVKLVENTSAVIDEENGQTGQFEADLTNLTKNDAVIFYAGAEEITTSIGSEPETATDKNLIKGQVGAYYIHNDAVISHITLKTWTTGISFWATGFVKSEEDQPESKYQVVIAGKRYECTHNPNPMDSSFDEWFSIGVPAKVGDEMQCYDYENNATWTIANLDPYSVGFTLTLDGKIVCTEDGYYDFYLKFKWQEDQVYIGKSTD